MATASQRPTQHRTDLAASLLQIGALYQPNSLEAAGSCKPYWCVLMCDKTGQIKLSWPWNTGCVCV